MNQATIESIIRKAVNDHLVVHIDVHPDRRDRIDILVEQAAKEILLRIKKS